MLDTARILEIARRVARVHVPEAGVERILAEPTTDSQGADALWITIVLKIEAADKMTGDDAIELLVGLSRSLRDAGEDRLPIIEYATEQELQLDDAED